MLNQLSVVNGHEMDKKCEYVIWINLNQIWDF